MWPQIYHAGRETSSAITGERPVGPSPIREPSMPETPRELTVEEIHQLVEQFGDCARRAQQAGFDGVEVHGATATWWGLSPRPLPTSAATSTAAPSRTGRGSRWKSSGTSNRNAGADFPVLYRMSAVEYVPGGLEIEEAKVLARLVEEAGADCIHCSQGVYASTQHIIPPSVVARGAYVQNAAAIKSAVHIPVIAVGRINDIQMAESILQSGQADLVTMARASLADPEMPKKIQEGREDEVLRCIGCLQGCAGGKRQRPLCPLPGEPPDGHGGRVRLLSRQGAQACAGHWRGRVRVRGGHRRGPEGSPGDAAGEKRPAGRPVDSRLPAVGKSEFTSLLLWQRKPCWRSSTSRCC